MKIELTITLDLPDDLMGDVNALTDMELEQELFNEYIRFAQVQHVLEAILWGTKWGTKGEPGADLIRDHHATWGKICSSAKWSFQRKD